MSPQIPEELPLPRLLGAHLQGGPPLGEIFLDLEPGLVVLYGRNGAGKTRIVEALAEAIDGRSRGASDDERQVREIVYRWEPDNIPREDFDRFFLGIGDGLGGEGRWWWELPGNPWNRGRGDSAFASVLGDALSGGLAEDASGLDKARHLIKQYLASKPELGVPIRRLAHDIVMESAPLEMGSEFVIRLNVGAALELARQGLFTVRQIVRGGNPHSRLSVRGVIDQDSPVLSGMARLLTGCDLPTLMDLAKGPDSWSLDNEETDDADDVPQPDGSEPQDGDSVAERLDKCGPDEWFNHVLQSEFGLLLSQAESLYLVAGESERVTPAWFGDEFVTLADDSPTVPANLVVELPAETLDVRTFEALARLVTPKSEEGEPTLLIERDGWITLNPSARDVAAGMATSANRWCSQLLENAPLLDLVFAPPSRWVMEPPVTWRAIDPSGSLVRLNQLSSAQRRWTSFAVQLALLEQLVLPLIVLLDEPEAALHRRAERHLAAGLQRMASELNATVVVATHSPSFLSLESARLVHVHRGSAGRTAVEPMDRSFRQRLDGLGLDPADLLQFCRTALLVEGEHELLIFRELFKDEFARMGVELFALRGASQLKNASDAQLFFRYTDAELVVVLDNQDNRRVTDVWDRARSAFDDGQDHLVILNELTKNGWTSEAKFIVEFCALALTFHSRDRIRFHTMSKPDIVDYLPLSVIAPAATQIGAWEDLRVIYERSGSKQNFKVWLGSTYGARYDEETVLSATRALDHIPEEFTELLRQVFPQS